MLAQATFPLFSIGLYDNGGAGILHKAHLEENYEVRYALRTSVKGRYKAHPIQKTLYNQLVGPKVRVLVRRSGSLYYWIFVNQQYGKFPVTGRGSYIIKKSLVTNKIEQIKVYVENGEESYIRLYSKGSVSSGLDFYLYGIALYSGITVPVPLAQLASMPLSSVITLTQGRVRWSAILPNIQKYAPKQGSSESYVAGMAQKIRQALPLGTHNDGAQDAKGQFVYISNNHLQESNWGFNCSGFVKWIVDGIYQGLIANRGTAKTQPQYLPIAPLRERLFSDRPENAWNHTYEFKRDPFFGLDWARNLAYAIAKKRTSSEQYSKTDFDVRNLVGLRRSGDRGYSAENLMPALYLSAIKNPNFFFIGEISGYFGQKPRLLQYYHEIAFFPYFDQHGDFHVYMAETGVSTKLSNLYGRYGKNFYVNLIRIQAPKSYTPPAFSL